MELKLEKSRKTKRKSSQTSICFARVLMDGKGNKKLLGIDAGESSFSMCEFALLREHLLIISTKLEGYQGELKVQR